ncbi:hypothetical protein C4K27_2734 [Pseudomonas chlororaphis subsp. chlororaphis]|nr:hypothetical protein C4K27_2734 [Pseudomonas chlororaphis subsp. chlororaphis]
MSVIYEVGIYNDRHEDSHHGHRSDATAYPAILRHQAFLLFYMHKGTASGSRLVQQKLNLGSQSAVLFL